MTRSLQKYQGGLGGDKDLEEVAVEVIRALRRCQGPQGGDKDIEEVTRTLRR